MSTEHLHESLDILHDRREIPVQRLLDDVLATLDDVIPALGDVHLITKCQNLRFMLSHVVIEAPEESSE